MSYYPPFNMPYNNMIHSDIIIENNYISRFV